MIFVGFAVFVGCAMIAIQLVEINKTLKMILKRYAALENLGLFPEEEGGITIHAATTAYDEGYKDGFRKGETISKKARKH